MGIPHRKYLLKNPGKWEIFARSRAYKIQQYEELLETYNMRKCSLSFKIPGIWGFPKKSNLQQNPGKWEIFTRNKVYKNPAI